MRVIFEIQAHNNEQLLTDVGYVIAHFCLRQSNVNINCYVSSV
jgi:hypothetical protein